MQAVKPKVASKQQTISSLKTSTAAVRNSIRIMTSAVAFQRSLFPLEDFKDRDYCGIDLKILNPVKKANGARMFVDYLEKGVFDAFEKGFVDRIMLNIHDSDPTEKSSSIIESYAFRVDYNKGRIIAEEGNKPVGEAMQRTNTALPAYSSKRITRDQVVQQTRSMIKTLTSTMAGLPPLPDSKWITFYLSYHDHTPESYEPPLFEKAMGSPVPIFKAPALTMRQGAAETGYHSLEVKVRTCTGEDDIDVDSRSEHVDEATRHHLRVPINEGMEQDNDDSDIDTDFEEKKCLPKATPHARSEIGRSNDKVAHKSVPNSLYNSSHEKEEAAAQLASHFAKTQINDDAANHHASKDRNGTWGESKIAMYTAFALALSQEMDCAPAAAIKRTAWSTSLSVTVQDEFLERYIAENPHHTGDTAPAHRAPLTERPISASHPSRAAWSQNSFESEQENLMKLSKSKRPLRCHSEGHGATSAANSKAVSKRRRR